MRKLTFLDYLRFLGLTQSQDLAAFVVIIGFSFRSGLGGDMVSMSGSSIIKTIAQDATVYFFFIFTSHLVFVLTLVLARVSTLRG